MLESHDYVRCITIDYSKAFDVINHNILIGKLKTLPLPNTILKWIISFLTNRTQAVKINGSLSQFENITQSIIQGSGLGPYLFIIFASDLHPINTCNILSKYADDMTLLSPSGAVITIEEEFDNVINWAAKNKLKINFSKTKEIVFRRPHLRNYTPIPLIRDIERVQTLKLLGCILS
jgi:hypothetical protein